MLRAYLYLVLSGIIWLVEGFLFSHYLEFRTLQIVLLGVLYVTLFALAATLFVRSLSQSPAGDADLSPWRVVSLLPMVIVILGSFASLPLIILVAALGKVI